MNEGNYIDLLQDNKHELETRIEADAKRLLGHPLAVQYDTCLPRAFGVYGANEPPSLLFLGHCQAVKNQ